MCNLLGYVSIFISVPWYFNVSNLLRLRSCYWIGVNGVVVVRHRLIVVVIMVFPFYGGIANSRDFFFARVCVLVFFLQWNGVRGSIHILVPSTMLCHDMIWQPAKAYLLWSNCDEAWDAKQKFARVPLKSDFSSRRTCWVFLLLLGLWIHMCIIQVRRTKRHTNNYYIINKTYVQAHTM